MLETESVLHSHSTLNRLVEEIQVHTGLLVDPLMDPAEVRTLFEELLGFVVHFGVELREHVAAEERDVFPVLKRRVGATYSANIDSLYDEHRALDVSLSCLANELERALQTHECALFRSQVMVHAQELIDKFYTHGRNEREAFIKAGIESFHP